LIWIDLIWIGLDWFGLIWGLPAAAACYTAPQTTNLPLRVVMVVMVVVWLGLLGRKDD